MLRGEMYRTENRRMKEKLGGKLHFYSLDSSKKGAGCGAFKAAAPVSFTQVVDQAACCFPATTNAIRDLLLVA
jgi:hypothetical protein